MASGMTVLKVLEYAAKELRDELPLDFYYDVDQAAALLDRLRALAEVERLYGMLRFAAVRATVEAAVAVDEGRDLDATQFDGYRRVAKELAEMFMPERVAALLRDTGETGRS